MSDARPGNNGGAGLARSEAARPGRRRSGAAKGHRRDRPRVIETSDSTLFFYQDRVLKVRRPVLHGTVDVRLLDRRRLDAEREVALNRPLAADVYLGSAAVSVDGVPVEHAVVMRRLPEERNLAAMIRRHRPLEAEAGEVASMLAAFHTAADRSPRIDAAATGAALWQRWLNVEEQLVPFVGTLVDPSRYREMTALARRFVEGREPLFRNRIAEGAVCDGHGNLEVAHVFCLEDGPRLLDRPTFDEQFRFADGLSDVASLVQDLEVLGAGTLADALVDAYGQHSGSEQPPSLLHYYVAQRAHRQLLVQCVRQEQGLRAEVPPELLVDQATAHLRWALPRLVLVGGLPGSGKSTVAAWVGGQLGASVLPHEQCGPDPRACSEEPPGHDGCQSGHSCATAQVCDRVVALLSMGRSVVLDTTWSARGDQELAATLAHRTGATLVMLWCQCSREERLARLASAAGAPAACGGTQPEGTQPSEDPWPGALVVDTTAIVRE